jgi:hypothetical protein
MPFPYTTYRILCSTPQDLDAERLAFLSANAKFGEEVTLPAQVLFAVASLPASANPNLQKAAIESNIRMVDFFVHVFGQDAPEPVYKGFVDYALECLADPAKPLRSVAVLFKASPPGSGEVRKIREELASGGRCEIREFHDVQELEQQARAILETWYELARAGPNTPG